MSYFGAVKVRDVNGNIVELSNVDELLQEISTTLKLILSQLEDMTDNQVSKEDIDDGNCD
jgi:hypothetical protein